MQISNRKVPIGLFDESTIDGLQILERDLIGQPDQLFRILEQFRITFECKDFAVGVSDVTNVGFVGFVGFI